MKVDDVVVVIETDKVAVEVRAQNAGVIDKAFADAGVVVEVGKPLFAIAPGAGGAAPAPAPAAAKAPAPAPAAAAAAAPAPAAGGAPVVQKVPSMGDSITQGKILEWKKSALRCLFVCCVCS